MFGMPVDASRSGRDRRPAEGRAARRARSPPTSRWSSRTACASSIAGQFVEFFGPGVSTLPSAASAPWSPTWRPSTAPAPASSRSTTRTLDYLRSTGRAGATRAWSRRYAAGNRLWFDPREPRYTGRIEIDLSAVERQHRRAEAAAGPARRGGPGDPFGRGARTARNAGPRAVAIAAITSCTNTTDPRCCRRRAARKQGAGERLRPPLGQDLALARLARGRTLSRAAGLLEDLDAVGFGIVGYGCMTCIGNSGPLPEPIDRPDGEAVPRSPCCPATATSPAACTRGSRPLPRLAAARRGLRARRRRQPRHPATTRSARPRWSEG